MKHRISLIVLASAVLGLTGCKLELASSSSAQLFPGDSSKSAEESSSSSSRSSTGGKTGTSSSASSKDTEGITYWCPTLENEFFQAKAKEFKHLHPEFKGDITCLGNVGEGDAWVELSKDPEAAADLFCMSSDSNPDTFITPLSQSEIADMEGRFTETSLLSTWLKGSYYGVPYCGDTGYVLFYNKAVVSDEDAKTLEGIIAACKSAGMPFYFDFSNSWYTFSPVWAAGGETYTDDQGIFHSEIATDEVAEALVGFQQIVLNAGNTWVHSTFGFDDQSMFGAVIQWNNEEHFKKLLGSDLGVAPLPSYSVNGISYGLKSFQAHKQLCIRKAKALTPEKLAFARAFRAFLTTDENARDRLDHFPNQNVPNLSVIEDESAWNPDFGFARALTDMELQGRTVAQANGSCPGFWSPAQQLGERLRKGMLTNKEAALAALQECASLQMDYSYSY